MVKFLGGIGTLLLVGLALYVVLIFDPFKWGLFYSERFTWSEISTANQHALDAWKKHEEVVERAIKGEQRDDEFGDACLFFEQVTGISIHVNIFTLGYAPEAEAVNDLKLIKAWYRENHARLYWDEATKTVKVKSSAGKT